MPYVMVPVPEEHVQEVMEAVLRISKRASLTEWDQEAITEFYNGVDEAARSLLAIVARATLAGKQLSHPELADATHITTREVSGILRDVNVLSTDLGRPILLISTEMDEVLPNGRVRTVRVITMDRTTAPLVNTAEREELAQAPNPVAGIDE